MTLFNTHSEYVQTDRPNVSYCINQDEVHYNDVFIHFEDQNVKNILVGLWGGADGGTAALNTRVGNKKVLGAAGEITYEQAASVTNMINTFINNTTIRKFDELQYFTSINTCPCFQGCTMESFTVPPNVYVFRDNTAYSSKIENIHILGDTVTTVGANCFRSNYITNVYVDTLDWFFGYAPLGIESTPLWIASNLYVNGTLTTHINIPNTVTTLYCQFASAAIHSMTLPNSITTIQGGAFRKTQMQTLTIPASVTTMGANMWYNTTLQELIMLPTTPPTIQSSTFTNSNITTIKVPAASLNDYKTATNWSSVANKIQAIS